MQGGMKREWARPLNPRARGNVAYGNWTGRGAPFNILNLQSGFHYKLATDDTVDSELLRGYEVIKTSAHKERFTGYGRVSQRYGAVQSGEMKLGPYYLVRTPIENFAEIRKRARDRRFAGMDIPTNTVLSQNPIERQALLNRGANYLPKSGEVFFKGPEHGENGFHTVEIQPNGEK